MKMEAELVIHEHTVKAYGKPEVSENLNTLSYAIDARDIDCQFWIRNQGKLMFQPGQKIRVTIEAID